MKLILESQSHMKSTTDWSEFYDKQVGFQYIALLDEINKILTANEQSWKPRLCFKFDQCLKTMIVL